VSQFKGSFQHCVHLRPEFPAIISDDDKILLKVVHSTRMDHWRSWVVPREPEAEVFELWRNHVTTRHPSARSLHLRIVAGHTTRERMTPRG